MEAIQNIHHAVRWVFWIVAIFMADIYINLGVYVAEASLLFLFWYSPIPDMMYAHFPCLFIWNGRRYINGLLPIKQHWSSHCLKVNAWNMKILLDIKEVVVNIVTKKLLKGHICNNNYDSQKNGLIQRLVTKSFGYGI